MRHHYKQPDVCQPFKTTRDYDKQRLSCLPPLSRVSLKLHKQRQWWDHNGRVVHFIFGSVRDAVICHTSTRTYNKSGPATTAVQERKRTHNGPVWGPQWALFLIQQAHKSACTPQHVWWMHPIKKKGHTIQCMAVRRGAMFSVSTRHQFPAEWLPFSHPSFLFAPSALSTVLLPFVLTVKWQWAPFISGIYCSHRCVDVCWLWWCGWDWARALGFVGDADRDSMQLQTWVLTYLSESVLLNISD